MASYSSLAPMAPAAAQHSCRCRGQRLFYFRRCLLHLQMKSPRGSCERCLLYPFNWDGGVSEPDGKETWGLIQSCLIILLLCVFTAIHLNIRQHESKGWTWLRHIIASLASALPDLMFFCALYQWSIAKQLQLQVTSLNEDVSLRH